MSEQTSDTYDYLIVGQGLAGTTLAWHLLGAGKKVLVVGDRSKPSSSLVAAGIFNPLTGKKLVKTWMADEIFPYANTFYTNLQEKFGIKLIHEMPIYRPYRSVEEQNTYIAQTGDPAIAPYIGEDRLSPDLSGFINADVGGLQVIRSGWVDLPALLLHSRMYFEQTGAYIEDDFIPAELSISDQYVRWKGKTFHKVIFCQGFMALENTFFNWLPFTPVKGQILEITTDTALPSYIVNQGIFMLPVEAGKTRVGATYSWNPLDWTPTDEATRELDEKMKNLLRTGYRIEGATAGVRPSVKDRRPLIGIHPEMRNVGIFNGLGTKGVTLAPFFAGEFTQHLETAKELNPLVNIQRYFSLYFR